MHPCTALSQADVIGETKFAVGRENRKFITHNRPVLIAIDPVVPIAIAH